MPKSVSFIPLVALDVEFADELLLDCVKLELCNPGLEFGTVESGQPVLLIGSLGLRMLPGAPQVSPPQVLLLKLEDFEVLLVEPVVPGAFVKLSLPGFVMKGRNFDFPGASVVLAFGLAIAKFLNISGSWLSDPCVPELPDC